MALNVADVFLVIAGNTFFKNKRSKRTKALKYNGCDRLSIVLKRNGSLLTALDATSVLSFERSEFLIIVRVFTLPELSLNDPPPDPGFDNSGLTRASRYSNYRQLLDDTENCEKSSYPQIFIKFHKNLAKRERTFSF